MKNKEELLEWLKKEIELENIQVIVPPSEEQLKEVIKESLKYPLIRELFEKILDLNDYQDKKREYKKKLRLMKECFNCNTITTHTFIDFEDNAYNKLKCLKCEHIGYLITRDNFNQFYDEKKIGVGDLTLITNCKHPFHIINCTHCKKYEICAKENWDKLSEFDKEIYYK
jgi:hypothetical protein